MWSFKLCFTKCWFVVTQFIFIKWSWEKFVLPGCPFFFLFLRPQPVDRFIYFLFSIGKDGKLFSSISFYQTEMVGKQQTNNSLSPVFVINSFLLITNNILVVAYLNCEQFGVLFGSYLRGFFFLCFFQSGIHREIRA